MPRASGHHRQLAGFMGLGSGVCLASVLVLSQNQSLSALPPLTTFQAMVRAKRSPANPFTRNFEPNQDFVSSCAQALVFTVAYVCIGSLALVKGTHAQAWFGLPVRASQPSHRL